jgi:hypothetical protein
MGKRAVPRLPPRGRVPPAVVAFPYAIGIVFFDDHAVRYVQQLNSLGKLIVVKIARVLSVGRLDPAEKGIDLTRAMSGNERVSMVEDLRRQMAKVTQREYPRRLRRVLEVAHRATG